MKLEQNDKTLLFSETTIPDIFFSDYLSQIPGDYLKIYLYIVFLSKYNKDIKLNDLSKKLNIPLKSISEGFKFLEENKLLTKKSTGYIIVDLQEATLHELYTPNLTVSKEKVAQTAKNQSRAKAIEHINNMYFQGIMSPSWYNDIDIWFRKYNFDEQVMIALFDYCYNRSAMHRNYVQTVAEAWASNKIKTWNDLDKYYEKQEKLNVMKKAIAKKAELDSKNTDDDFYKKGIALLDATIKNRDVNSDEIYNSLNQLSVLNYFEVASANDLIIAIGRKSISAQLVVSQCINLQPNLVVQINQMLKKNNANVSKKESKHDISIKGATGIKVETAPCCCPIPGDDIVGFITRGKGVKVHRINCPNIVHEKRRLIETTWNEVLDLTYYPVNLEIESVDRGNLVVDLMSMISLCKIKIDSISAKSHYETKTATISCTVYVSDVNHLDSLITKLKQIQGIYEVRRVFH